MGFVWVTDISVGAAVDAADRNETKDNIASLYTDLGKNWPGNVRFPNCGGAGFDMAAPCPVVWDIAVEDSIYQTPGAHPVSELQEARDKLDFLDDDHCGVDNGAHCNAEDSGKNVGANVGEDTGENVGADTGEDVGANIGANVGEDTGEDSGDNLGANIGADTGEDVGADTGANVGENSGEDVGANSGAFIGADYDAEVGDDGGHDTGLCLIDDIGAYSGDQDSNWGPNDVSDRVVELTFDIGCTGHFFTVNVNDH